MEGVNPFLLQIFIVVSADWSSNSTAKAITVKKEYDEFRSQIINEFRIKVIRFRNEQIEQHLEDVLKP